MIFYDFEVFKEDWLVVLIDPSKRQETVIVNDPDHLSRFHEENKHDIWVGFNSRHYDQYILKGILLGFDPKKINDWIIVKGKDGFQIHIVNEFLRSLVQDCADAPVVEFKSYSQYAGLLMDIHELIAESFEYAVDYGQTKKGFDTFEITEVYALED